MMQGSIHREEVDLPDKMSVEELDDYPPLIKIHAQASREISAQGSTELKVFGLNRECTTKLTLTTPVLPGRSHTFSQAPVSPSSLSDYSVRSSSLSWCGESVT